MKFILGKKIEMTQIFREDGNVVPVTSILAETNTITQIKSNDKDGYSAVQVGFGKAKNIKKPQVGHLKGLDELKKIKEFRIKQEEIADLKRGDKINVSIFEPGDKVKVTGNSKGKGFQGVVKRHGFHGSPASHGHKDQLRMPGSIGATDAARVFKGKKMPGRMGNDQVTVTGLEIVEIDKEKNILYIKGAVPGTRNTLLMIIGPGEMKVQKDVKSDAKSVESEEQVVEKENVINESENKTEMTSENIETPKVEQPQQPKEEKKEEIVDIK